MKRLGCPPNPAPPCLLAPYHLQQSVVSQYQLLRYNFVDVFKVLWGIFTT